MAGRPNQLILDEDSGAFFPVSVAAIGLLDSQAPSSVLAIDEEVLLATPGKLARYVRTSSNQITGAITQLDPASGNQFLLSAGNGLYFAARFDCAQTTAFLAYN